MSDNAGKFSHVVEGIDDVMSREDFFVECDKRIAKNVSGFYTMSCLDIDNFKVINDQYGMPGGDRVLLYVTNCLTECLKNNGGIHCRFSADRFAILYPTTMLQDSNVLECHKKIAHPDCISRSIRVRIGRCLIADASVRADITYERATMAEESIKGRYDIYIADYTDDMRTHLLREQQIVGDMNNALENNEFIPFFQPQYNHATGALIGAEALVRWKKDDSFISPGEFIPIFERNGFVYDLDKYIWEQVCILLKGWIQEGRNPLPVSVNISRFDLYKEDFMSVICGLVEKYDIPADLLRLEITESAFADSPKHIIQMANDLIEQGFTLEIDDFGSGYSSLNTLKDVPASIMKLDMKFFQNTDSRNSQRSGNIVESIVRMAKWLGMAVIAEGVEEKEQADFLKSIGCYYIQGYYYARPMPRADYEERMDSTIKEQKLTRVKSLINLDNGEFWNPKSMDTLIFNSYVGGACIFEYRNGTIELLRMNDQYIKEFGSILRSNTTFERMSPVPYLDEENTSVMNKTVLSVIKTGCEKSCELELVRKEKKKTHSEYMRSTIREIARTDDRHLFYCVIVNVTEQHVAEQKRKEAEQKEIESYQRLQIVMKNINGGVSAIIINDDMSSQFIFTNERYFELYGYTKEEAAAINLDVMTLVVEEDKKNILAKVKQLKKDRTPVVIDYRCVKKNGQIAYLRANCSILDSDINQNAITSVVTDITEQKLITEQLKAIIDSIDGGVTATIIRNGKRELMILNNQFYQLFGYSKAEYENEVNDAFERLHPDDREWVMRKFLDASSIGTKFSIEYRIVRRDQEVRWVQAIINTVKIFGIDELVKLTVTTDITEMRESEEKEREANEQLRFLNVVAHDILAQPDVDKAVNLALDKLIDYFGADRAYVVEINWLEHKAYNRYERCAVGVGMARSSLQGIPFSEDQFWVKTLEEKGLVNVPDLSQIVEEKEACAQLIRMGIHSQIMAAMKRDGVIIGFVGVDNLTKSKGKVERLEALGDYLAILATHKELHSLLRQEDDAIRLLMNDNPGGYCRLHVKRDGTPEIVSINNGFCNLLMMSENEIMRQYGQNANLILHPEEIELTWENSVEMLKHDGLISNRCRLRRKDDTFVDVMIFSKCEQSGNGDIFINTYYANMTEQATIENKQNELLDNLPCGAVLYEYDGVELSVIRMNKRYCQLIGRESSNCDKSFVKSTFYPDDIDVMREEIDAAYKQERDINCDVRIRYGNGGFRPFHMTGSINKNESGTDTIYSTYTPIEDKTMSIQEVLPIALSTMMTASTEIAYIKDRNLHYICCSNAAAKNLGIASAREIIGKTDYDLFPPEVAEKFGINDMKIINTGEPIINKVEGLPDMYGNPRTAKSSMYPLIDSRGQTIGIYGVSEDITKERERDLLISLMSDSISGGLATFEIMKDEMKLLFFSDAYYKVTGYNKETFINMMKKDSFVLIAPEDKEKMIKMINSLRENPKQTIGEFTYRIVTKSGQIRWMNLKGTVSGIDQNRYMLNIVRLDITGQKETEENLRQKEEEYEIAAKHSGQTIGRYNIATQTLTLTTQDAMRLLLPEIIEDIPYGRIKLGKISSETSSAYIEFFESIIHGKKEGTGVFQKLLPQGWRWLSAHFTTIFADDGTPVSAIISYTDITENYEKDAIYMKWQQSLDQRAKGTFSLYRCDLNQEAFLESTEGQLINFDEKLTKNFSFDECTRKYACRVMEEERENYIASIKCDKLIADFYRGKRNLVLEYREIIDSKNYRWIKRTVDLVERPESGGIMAYLMFEDIDVQKRKQLETLSMAKTDELTGLLNRKTFTTQLNQLLEERSGKQYTAFFILDIDGFKHINDTLGHAAGDRELIRIGKVITDTLEEGDFVGRLGGDEFVICLQKVSNRDAIRKRASKLWKLTHHIINDDLQLSSSIGIAIAPDDGNTFDELYHKADRALYKVKENGKDNYGY